MEVYNARMEILHGNRSELEAKAADLIVAKIAGLDSATLGLVGGSSVAGVYKRLFESKVDWLKVHIFMVDERCVPVTSEESNFRGIYEESLRKLISSGKLPEENVHAFHFDEIHDESCVVEYFQSLPHPALAGEPSERKFDIVILSAGEDGHVGSLFPNHRSVKDESEGYITVDEAPKLPSLRVSASRRLLEKSDMGVLLFFGEQKRKAFENFTDDKLSVIECPAKLTMKMGDVYVLENAS